MGDGPWRTAGVFTDRVEARAFVENRGGDGLALTCVTFVVQLVDAMLLVGAVLRVKRGVQCRGTKPARGRVGLARPPA